MMFIALIQVLIIYFGGEFFRSVPLSFREMLNVIIIAFSVIPFDFCRRLIQRLAAGERKSEKRLQVIPQQEV